jgi:hypothetical protein
MLDAGWTPDTSTQRTAFAQRDVSIHYWMLSFCVAHSYTLFILENLVSIVLFLQSKPNSHKAFSVVLTYDVFSGSAAAGKGSGKQGVLCGASPSGLKKRKEAAMTRVAYSITKTLVAYIMTSAWSKCN